ncbi:MAG: NnrU protein [Chromatiales bacterium]|nr:MAG: NnrU protein [Chromatiales bacterium]
MTLLITGLALWFVAHAFPAVAPEKREVLQQKLGRQPYRGVFSLIILAALLLIIFGWKSAVPHAVYVPPMGPGLLSSALVLAGLVLFFASQVSGHIKRTTRHPQMLGTILWAVAHLLTNGDSRSVALFGTLAVWALFEIVMINRRDGTITETPAASGKYDLVAIVIGGVVFAIVGHFHVQLFGVSPMPV